MMKCRIVSHHLYEDWKAERKIEAFEVEKEEEVKDNDIFVVRQNQEYTVMRKIL